MHCEEILSNIFEVLGVASLRFVIAYPKLIKAYDILFSIVKNLVYNFRYFSW